MSRPKNRAYTEGLDERRPDVIEDPRQLNHVSRRGWGNASGCTCRTRPDGTPFYVCVVATCTREGKACGGYCHKCFKAHMENVAFLATVPKIDFHYLAHQRAWSDEAFGPGKRTAGVLDHISKEIVEVSDSDGALDEWADIIILALDGASRAAVDEGRSVADVLRAVADKQALNERRTWPDWRTQDTDKAIEHDRTGEATP